MTLPTGLSSRPSSFPETGGKAPPVWRPEPSSSLAVTLEELKQDPDLREAVRALCRGSFYEFVKVGWAALFPRRKFIDGKHIRFICDTLQALTEGRFHRAIINIPPRHMKSTLVCILWVAWRFGPRDERIEFLFASLGQKLSQRDSRKCRDLIKSEWFRILWPDVRFRPDQDQKIDWELEGGGKRDTTSKNSQVTGSGGDVIGVDDLHDLNDTLNALAEAVDWYTGTLSSRENFGEMPPQEVMIMQRVGVGDVTGHVLATETIWKPGCTDPYAWVHVCLPCEYDPAHHCITPIGGDWRSDKGDLLWPEVYGPGGVRGPTWLDTKKRRLGPRNWASQYQQQPVPEGGKEFEAEWLGRRFPRLNADEVERWILSVDCAFKDGPAVDNVSIQLIAKVRGWYYIVDEVTDTMSWTTTKRTFEERYWYWRGLGIPIMTCLIEEAANGHALIDEFDKLLPGVFGFKTRGDSKVTRARGTTGIWAAGQVWLPMRNAILVIGNRLITLAAGWTSAYERQFLKFPDPREHDDSVDATTQAILYLEHALDEEEDDLLPLPMVG
jgi:predicted phage terminase large subunit-like protein